MEISVQCYTHLFTDYVYYATFKVSSIFLSSHPHLTISTLVAHSICRSFHITSSQSKSKKMTTTAGTSFWCFFNHPVFKMPLGMYHSYEVLWKWNPYTYFRVCVCARVCVCVCVCMCVFNRLIGVCFNTICKMFPLPSHYSQSGNLLQKKPCKVHQFSHFPFYFQILWNICKTLPVFTSCADNIHNKMSWWHEKVHFRHVVHGHWAITEVFMSKHYAQWTRLKSLRKTNRAL